MSDPIGTFVRRVVEDEDCPIYVGKQSEIVSIRDDGWFTLSDCDEFHNPHDFTPIGESK